MECQRSRRVRSSSTCPLSLHNRRAEVHDFVEVGFGPIREGHQDGVRITGDVRGIRAVGRVVAYFSHVG